MLSSAQQAAGVVQKYLRGLVISTMIVGVLSALVFLGLGINNVIFFAAFVAIFNLIPYVGVFIASAVCILYTFITKDSLLYPILVMVLLWAIQLLEGNVIRPLIVGREIKLNPFAIILIVFFGAMIWGISGMVLFIPILGVMKVFFDNIDPLKPYGYLLGDEE
jgi:predicted PurR-regulated permease PerM